MATATTETETPTMIGMRLFDDGFSLSKGVDVVIGTTMVEVVRVVLAVEFSTRVDVVCNGIVVTVDDNSKELLVVSTIGLV